MNNKEMFKLVNLIFSEIDKLIPVYLRGSEDSSVSTGNVAAFIIGETGDFQ